MIQTFTAKNSKLFSREIEYGWNFPKNEVHNTLLHSGVDILDSRQIEQLTLSVSSVLVDKNFDNQPIPTTACQVRTRVRKTTFLHQDSKSKAFKTGNTEFEYTTKYCLPNDDKDLPDDRMELNAPLTQREYEWLIANAVTEGGRVESQRKVRYTLKIEKKSDSNTVKEFYFSLDIPSTGETARLELELFHRKDADKSKWDYLPDWLREMLESEENENQGKSR